MKLKCNYGWNYLPARFGYEVYSFIKSQVTDRTCLQSKYKIYEIRPTMQASYTIGSGTTMQENQRAAQIAAKHSIFPQMAPYMSWIFKVLVGIDPGVSHLGGEIVSHNTTDARHWLIGGIFVQIIFCIFKGWAYGESWHVVSLHELPFRQRSTKYPVSETTDTTSENSDRYPHQWNDGYSPSIAKIDITYKYQILSLKIIIWTEFSTKS